METHETIDSARKAIAQERAAGHSVGLVPTMGALHAGHLSLIEKAAAECDVVVVSIFVNPMQFGVGEDLERYPRPFEDDQRLAREAGVHHLFAPSVKEMYPYGPVLTRVQVAELTQPLEGARRPGHFDGVTTVVAKLFNIVGECRAYFGEKDWQQLVVVKQMVADLNFPVTVVPCPIVRARDGLALSSRNVYLDASERMSALVLSRALGRGVTAISAGIRSPSTISGLMMEVMGSDSNVEPHYAAVVGPDLRWPETISGEVRLLVSARVGNVRLLDNTGLTVDAEGKVHRPRKTL